MRVVRSTYSVRSVREPVNIRSVTGSLEAGVGSSASSASVKRCSNERGCSNNQAGGIRSAAARASSVPIVGSSCSVSICSRSEMGRCEASDNDSKECLFDSLHSWMHGPMDMWRSYTRQENCINVLRKMLNRCVYSICYKAVQDAYENRV